eukprot:gene16646-19776_t
MLHTIGVDSPVVIRCAASVNPALVFSWKLETIAEAANASTTNRTMKAALTEFCGYKSIDDFDTIDRAYFTTTASMPSRQMAVDEYIRVCIDQAQGLYMRDVDRVVRGHDDAELENRDLTMVIDTLKRALRTKLAATIAAVEDVM